MKILDSFSKAFKAIMDAVMAIVRALFRIIGIVLPKSGGGGVSVPRLPQANAKASAGKGNEPGMSLEQKMKLCPIDKILAYAQLDKQKRFGFDTSTIPSLQLAWLKACDEDKLEKLKSMRPTEALDLVLSETQAIKKAMAAPGRRAKSPAIEAEPVRPTLRRGPNTSPAASMGLAV